MNFIEEVDWLIFGGIVEGKDVLTLINLLRSHLKGSIDAEEIVRGIDYFKAEFYRKKMQGVSNPDY